jgi:hypothetical protein
MMPTQRAIRQKAKEKETRSTLKDSAVIQFNLALNDFSLKPECNAKLFNIN